MNDKAGQSYAPALSVAGLSKRYGATEAVCGLTFEVAAGQIFGLLGPNGAGKTTTLECILGLQRPDTGSIRVDGWDVTTHASRTRLLIGAQLQAATLQDKITPRQALDLFGSFYPQRCAADELLSRFDLSDKADVHFVTLSGGQKQRFFLALALINRPSLLVLDEPTAGLDPRSRHTLRACIRDLRTEGRTVLLSTHDLEEAAQLCDRVAVMDRGRMIAVAPPSELVGRAKSPTRVVVRTSPPLTRTLVDSLPHLLGSVCDDRGWTLDTPAPNRLLAELVRRMDNAGAELLDIQIRRPSLEDVFVELTGHSWFGEQDHRGVP